MNCAPIVGPDSLAGPLLKWTNHITGWQYRWFVLQISRRTLVYYRSRDISQPSRGSIVVSGTEMPEDGEEDEGQFTVSGVNSQLFYLRATSAREREQWMETLRRAALSSFDTNAAALPSVNGPLNLLGTSKSTSKSHQAALGGVRGSSTSNGQTLGTAMAESRHRLGSHNAAVYQRLVEAGAYRDLLIQQIKGFVDVHCTDSDAGESVRVIEATSAALVRTIDQALSAIRQREGDGGYYRPTTSQWGVRNLDGVIDSPVSSSPIDSISTGQPKPAATDAAPVASTSMLSVSSSSRARSVSDVSGDLFFDAETNLEQDDADSGNDDEALQDVSSDEEAEDDSEQKSVILHLLSQLRIGMDLTKVALPTFILERRSLLEMYADFMAHPDIFSNISVSSDPKQRMMAVIRWYLTAFHSGRKSSVAKKPYNPIIGELFSCEYRMDDGSKLSFIAEQVSHHPPVSAFYAECKEKKISLNAHIYTKSKFLGLSVAVENVGQGCIRLHEYNEDYILTFPDGYARSILSIPWVELGGTTWITCDQTGFKAKIVFQTKPTFGGKANKIDCQLYHISNPKKALCSITGEWNGVMNIVENGGASKLFVDIHDLPIARKCVKPLSMQHEFESRKLWQHVTDGLKTRDVAKATEAKHRLESRQREEAKERKAAGVEWQTKKFHLDDSGKNWRYDGAMQ